MNLEGNELEKVYDGGAGKMFVDVTDTGSVKLGNVYEKDLGGFAKVKSVTELESNIFMIAKAITAKTETVWDDMAVEGLMKILGIKDEAVKAAALASL